MVMTVFLFDEYGRCPVLVRIHCFGYPRLAHLLLMISFASVLLVGMHGPNELGVNILECILSRLYI